MEAELRLADRSSEGCDLYAGCHVRITPQGVCLAVECEDDIASDGPDGVKGTAKKSPSLTKPGFPLDTTQWHRYKIVRTEEEIAVYVDGRLRLSEAASPICVPVRSLWQQIAGRFPLAGGERIRQESAITQHRLVLAGRFGDLSRPVPARADGTPRRHRRLGL